MRESNSFDLLVDEDEFQSEALVHAPQDQRGGSVAAIDHAREARPAAAKIVSVRKIVEIMINRARVIAQLPHARPIGERELLQMIDVEKFFGFRSREIAALSAEKFQRVPFRGIVARADRDAPGRSEAADGVLKDRRGNDSQIGHLVPACHQRGDYAFADHQAARARVAADQHNARWFEKRAEGGGEVKHVRGRQARTHYAA